MEYHLDYPTLVKDTIKVGNEQYWKLIDGTFLHLQVIPDEYLYLRIFPDTNPPAQCWALLQGNILTIALFTRDESKNPFSEFLYAKEFFDFSIRYFGIDNIDQIRGDLGPGSSIRDEIIDAYDQTADIEHAINQCTFARVSKLYGFSRSMYKLLPSINPEMDPWGALEIAMYKE